MTSSLKGMQEALVGDFSSVGNPWSNAYL